MADAHDSDRSDQPASSGSSRQRRRGHRPLGGVIHTYQGYDPAKFPPPTQPPGDMVSGAVDHLLTYGSTRELTAEELAQAIKLDPSQIQGLGPSLDSLIAMLEERKAKILATWETKRVQADAARAFHEEAAAVSPPDELRKVFNREVKGEQLRGLERLWYAAERMDERFAARLPGLIEILGEKYEVDALASKYTFTGRDRMSIRQAIAIKEELEEIDRLLEQLREAMKNAQLAIIDMDALANYASEQDMGELEGLREQVEEMVRAMAENQGIEQTADGYRLTPKAMRLFQSRLLETIFSDLNASRSGRHEGPIAGEGAVETPRTRGYEFGDSPAHMDIPGTVVNAMLRRGGKSVADDGGVLFRSDDILIHETRNNPKCATVVIMDMSGSMRWSGLYVGCKRMALALDGLVRREYPGDSLQFIEMYSFAKPVHVSDVAGLMPKPVTIRHPVVQLKADMSDPDISELQIPPHFTNIQHALQLARQFLDVQDTPNKQIMLITDGLPTAHFEGSELYLLYPPHSRTEEATMREAMRCQQEGITMNVFLLPTWSQSSEDVQFAHRMAEQTGGRVFFAGGEELDRFVLWDYVSRRRRVIS
ncbi:MAG: hypothetical protein AB8G96_13200 [Phycisphaerales bacterium]